LRIIAWTEFCRSLCLPELTKEQMDAMVEEIFFFHQQIIRNCRRSEVKQETKLMKQVLQNYKSGELILEDVARPVCKPGCVLVQTAYSLVSSGTERMKVEQAKMSLIGKDEGAARPSTEVSAKR